MNKSNISMKNLASNSKPDPSYKKIQKIVNTRIANNLSSLLKERGLTPTLFIEHQHLNDFFTPQHFNRLFNHPDQPPLSAVTVALMCDFFGVTFDNLISENFDPKEYKKSNTKLHKLYLDIEKVSQTENYQKQHTIPDFYFDFENTDTIHSSPKSRFFKGYFQNFFCYFFPTSSAENKQEKLLYGRLELSDAEKHCKVSLKIDTSGKYPETENDFKCDKEYVGYAVISSSVQTVYCILFGNDPGEFCFIAFRYMFLTKNNLHCRIAEVLSSSSGNGARRPTVLRMFISNTHIKQEHIPLITSAIHLNYSDIGISQSNLKELSIHSENYKKIIDNLINDYKKETFFVFDEKKEIITTAEKYLTKKEEIFDFIVALRNLSYSYRYNKISDSADDTIQYLLVQKGYYNDQK